MPKKDRTLIIGAYGYGNMGDEAILQGILEVIGNRENIDVISATPHETENLHRVRAVLENDIDYSKYSCVILGGGGYRPGAYKFPMKICLRLKERGARLIVKAIGLTPEIAGRDDFGPDELGIEEKNILSDIVKQADYFSVRTHKDLWRLKKYIDIKREIEVETCPAYNITFSKKKGKEILNEFGISIDDKLCGVSLAKFGYREGIKNFLENYKRIFIFIPIPMCRHYYTAFENDILLLNRYFKELKLLSKNIIRLMKYPFNPSEIKAVLSNLTFLVTARKHAMVLALGAGIRPEQVILLGTHESGMAEYFGVKEIDWRQWPRSKKNLKFPFAGLKSKINNYVKLLKNSLPFTTITQNEKK